MARPLSHHTESTRLQGAEGMPLMFEEKLSDSLKCLLKNKRERNHKIVKAKVILQNVTSAK